MTSPRPDILLVIPARLGSQRLAGKLLAPAGGVPLLVHSWRAACAAQTGRVIVAAADQALADLIRAQGGEAVMTAANLACGTDRAAAALQQIDSEGRYQTIVNMQGDLPFMPPDAIRAALAAHNAAQSDIASLAAPLAQGEAENPNVVKAILTQHKEPARALYFTRQPVQYGWHHIGLYVFARAALERFADLPPSPLEQAEKLEQLRALEAGMTIAMARIDSAPLSVDSAAGLARAQTLARSASGSAL